MNCFLKYIPFLLFAALLASCSDTASKQQDLVEYIPENPELVLKISNFEALQSDLKNNSLLAAFDDTAPYRFFSEKANILTHINSNSESLLCMHAQGEDSLAYTFITKYHQDLFRIDSIENKTTKTLSHDQKELQQITIANQTAYSTVLDSTFIASSSLILLKEIMDGKIEKDAAFRKMYTIKNGNDLTIIKKGIALSLEDSIAKPFASWSVLETEILPNGITATGVALARDSINQLLNVFKGQIPQQNDLVKVIPANAKKALVFTFSDPEIFIKNNNPIIDSTQQEAVTHSLFGSINEAGWVALKDEKVVVLKSIDPSITQEDLGPYLSEHSNFRDVAISSFTETDLFKNAFPLFMQEPTPAFACWLDDFFIFTETEEAAQEIITAYVNNTTLFQMPHYTGSASQLSNASSLTLYSLQGAIGSSVSGFFNWKNQQALNKIISKEYPLGVVQFSYDRDFAHVNIVCKEASQGVTTGGLIGQKFSLTLDNDLMSDPQFFTNHRTQGKDIVVQDITNKLYFISSGGKLLWTKNLKSPILGEVHEVDLLRNGKKQLAFTTQNALHVYDRNGKKVGPFPLLFQDDITQPLSVFDYDNNRKYRFVVTQGRELLMYDSKGKIVKGFTYKMAPSNVVLPPQHIRMGNKDYLLIAQENGTLTILNRVGKNRVSVSKKFEFYEIPIAREGSDFVVITKNGTKERISQSGKVTSQALNVSESYWFTVLGATKATMDDNLLRINGKLIDLPFGIYTQPRIRIANRKTYVSVTETQENKVYVFDKLGNQLPGAPVYGTGLADVCDIKSEGKRYLVVKGLGAELILYSF